MTAFFSQFQRVSATFKLAKSLPHTGSESVRGPERPGGTFVKFREAGLGAPCFWLPGPSPHGAPWQLRHQQLNAKEVPPRSGSEPRTPCPSNSHGAKGHTPHRAAPQPRAFPLWRRPRRICPSRPRKDSARAGVWALARRRRVLLKALNLHYLLPRLCRGAGPLVLSSAPDSQVTARKAGQVIQNPQLGRRFPIRKHVVTAQPGEGR